MTGFGVGPATPGAAAAFTVREAGTGIVASTLAAPGAAAAFTVQEAGTGVVASTLGASFEVGREAIRRRPLVLNHHARVPRLWLGGFDPKSIQTQRG